MIRRSCAEAVGGFDTRLRVAEDVDFYARAIRQFGAQFIDRVTLRYRIWNASLMHTPHLSRPWCVTVTAQSTHAIAANAAALIILQRRF